MTDGGSNGRVAAIILACVAFVLGAGVVLVSTASPTSAVDPTVVSGAVGPASLAYDLDGLPDGAVLVVERRNGPKGSFTEVARSTRSSGGLEVGVPTDPKSILRFTLVSANGDVLAVVDRQY
jgi:hypothetical protein